MILICLYNIVYSVMKEKSYSSFNVRRRPTLPSNKQEQVQSSLCEIRNRPLQLSIKCPPYRVRSAVLQFLQTPPSLTDRMVPHCQRTHPSVKGPAIIAVHHRNDSHKEGGVHKLVLYSWNLQK
ncbi:hypothetical protein Zmor_012852 [Zophobas morio]|uniref:Uncharacterized protein n=1 Tax=Zophobas morio TaxID=2755281 RepID=A0AA38IEA1_9CUCU|nr:hypothetical protein Zmor_012852 [Zophobas morio]